MREDRNQMIVNHLPLVAFVVNRMPSEGAGAVGIDREDAMSYGVEGLIHAVDAYDPDRGTTFASFAIQRIRGSVLDAVRKQDPLPRSLRRNAKEIEHASQELAVQLGPLAYAEGNSVQAGNPADRASSTFWGAPALASSLSSIHWRTGPTTAAVTPWTRWTRTSSRIPARAAEQRAALFHLSRAVNSLCRRDRAILRLRYEECQPFHEIGRDARALRVEGLPASQADHQLLRREMRPQLQEAA